jgi:hypothetical protein
MGSGYIKGLDAARLAKQVFRFVRIEGVGFQIILSGNQVKDQVSEPGRPGATVTRPAPPRDPESTEVR